ncbi:MAG: sulfatase-like hydrolase/transferase [Verrucomicrobia bacterium]|nr:sulfatase-like hydrolase/transferase [Verrucomicrobiota bacterium]
MKLKYISLLVCLFAIHALSSHASPAKRNVVFILSDDHRFDFMGFTGKLPWLKTPQMDRMAREGTYFDQAYVSTSLCSPSRASILTGLYAHTHTIVDNQAPNPGNLTYFPEYLQAAGYQTAFIGKWHMGDESDEPQPGFDHWESFKGQGVYDGVTLNINGERVSYGAEVYTSDLLTAHAVDWMESLENDQPFFLYLSHKAVHAEFKQATRHAGMYAGVEYELPVTYTQTKDGSYKDLLWPEWVKEQRHSWHGVDFMYHDKGSVEDLVIDYCETLMGVDDSIGTVMAYLESRGIADETVVIYMGDNGFSWGEHGLIDKRHFYEESAKVPLLVRCPELFEGGETLHSLVQNIDIAPTVMALAGLDKEPAMHGASFLPLLVGEAVDWRDKVFYEYYWEYDFPMTPSVFGVRTDRYKYIRYHGLWERNELYDLENDPHEMYNLIESPEHQEIIRQLAGEIYDWLETTGGMQIPLKRTIKHRWGDYRHSGQY